MSITLPNIVLPGIAIPAVNVPLGGGPVVNLPALSVPSINVLNTAGLPASLNLPANVDVLLVNLPGVSILAPGLASLSALGSGVLGLVLNQVGQVEQLLAGVLGTNLLGPVEQLLNGLTGGGGDPAWSPLNAFGPSGQVAQLGFGSAWMWNAATISSTRHSGFGVEVNGAYAGTAPAMRSVDKAYLPGVLFDASSAFGLRRGMLHIGLTGGISESDIKISGTDATQALGLGKLGKANLTTWSIGAFALLTTGSWYTGGVIGGAWGQSEVDNYLLTATSDYNATNFTSAWILGTVVPLTNTLRLDIRGTLGYQRTVGEDHVDSLGIAYGEHVSESVHASISGRAFGVFRQNALTYRPYLQAGVGHRLHYENTIDIAGVTFAFSDADTTVFGAAGVDIEFGQGLQLTFGVRQDHSADFDSLTGRFGFAWKFN